MVYGDFKYKVLRGKWFNIVKNSKYDAYQRDLTSMVYKCFDKEPALLAWSET